LFCLAAAGCAVQQPRFDGTVASLRSALLRGEIKDALAFYEAEARQAEKNATSSSFPQQYWRAAIGAYLRAAQAASYAGQLQKAITYGEKALEIAFRTKAPILDQGAQRYLQWPPIPELTTINSLVAAYTSVRDFDKARVLVDRGLTLLKENPSGGIARLPRESSLYAALGSDLLRGGEYEKAIDAHLQAVSSQRSHFFAQSRPGVSRQYVEGAEIQLTGRLIQLARAYRLAGRLGDALAQYNGASKHVSVGGPATNEQTLFSGLGEVYLQQKQFPLALENFHKALSLAEKQQHSDIIRSASAGVAASLRQAGKATEAIPYYQKAIQQIESTRSLLQSEEYRQTFFEGGIDAYSDMVDVLADAGRTDEAFNFAERARSRALLDLIGSKAQLSSLASGLIQEERALLERIAGSKARLAGEDGEAIDGAAVAQRQLAEAEKAYTAFLSRVRKENKEQASLMNVEPLTVKQVQELLDPGVVVLEYFVTQDGVLLWIVDKDKVASVKIPLPRKELQAKVSNFRVAIQQFDENEKFRQQSEQLFKVLLQPALQHIRGKELLIIPHDVLHYVPFQALLAPNGKYLIEDYPINYLSSASLMQFTQEKRKAKGELTSILAQAGKVLALGNPDLGDTKMSLQYAGIEAKEIKALYPQSTVYLEKEATEERAKSLSPQNDIIHFASHAELNENDPLASAILLAKSNKEDGRLEVREIFGMDLKASLVVLSACETGLGKLSSGDELVGLTRAFIYAGTPSVVASLWNVEDSSTSQLMASFYKNLKTMTKVEALRQAQLQLIRGNINSDLLARRGIGGVGKLGETPSSVLPAPSSEPPAPSVVTTSHPYFWAPFILVGEGK